MNCLIVDDEPIAQNILKGFVSKVDYLNLVAACANSNEAFNLIQKEDIELIFWISTCRELMGWHWPKSFRPIFM